MFFPIPTSIQHGPSGRTPPLANSVIIAINVLLYCLGFSAAWGVGRGSSPLGILTHGFVHAGFLHLLGNMWLLQLFGNAVNRRLGNELYTLCYLGIVVSVGLCGWIAADGILVGSSGAIYGVMGIATLLLPAARVRVYYVALFPITLIVGLFQRPAHWLGWVIRWDHFSCLMLWAIALVPMIELFGLWSWYRVGLWSWNHLAHLLGFGFGFLAVLLLPTRVSMRPATA
jgi:membrane associated rhomboid family serine protease